MTASPGWTSIWDTGGSDGYMLNLSIMILNVIIGNLEDINDTINR